MKTKIIKIDPDKPDKSKIKECAKTLKGGGLVAFPTETVYGLGAIHNNKEAVEKIYSVKRRPTEKPLTIHISNIKSIDKFNCEIPHLVKTLIDKFWPGPLTIILNTKDKAKKIAFRMPDSKIAKALIEYSGEELVAPSANISGNKPPVDAEDVIEELNEKIDIIINAGPTRLAEESTVIDATAFPYRVLREGAISKTKIQDAWQHE